MCAAKSAKHLNANRRTIRRTADPPLSLSPSLPFFSSPLYRPALFYLSAIPSNHSAIPNYAILSIESAIHYDGIVPVSHKHLWRAFFFLFLLLLLPAQKSMFFFCLCLHNKKKKKILFFAFVLKFFLFNSVRRISRLLDSWLICLRFNLILAKIYSLLSWKLSLTVKESIDMPVLKLLFLLYYLFIFKNPVYYLLGNQSWKSFYFDVNFRFPS